MDNLLATIKNNLFLKILTIVNIGWLISLTAFFFEFLDNGIDGGFGIIYLLWLVPSLPFLILYILVAMVRIKKLDIFDKFFLVIFFGGLIFNMIEIVIVLNRMYTSFV